MGRTLVYRFTVAVAVLGVFCLGSLPRTVVPTAHAAGNWSNTGSMHVARQNHTATLLANGEVLVVGGDNNATGYLASAEVYNPATGKWTLTGNLTIARDDSAAALLPNGQVLVAGGLDPNGCCGAPPLTSAELYTPATNTWTATGSMAVGRTSFILMPLPNGKVLAAGGFDNGTQLSSAELYNPATGTWTATGSMTGGDGGPDAVLLPNGEVLVTRIDNLYDPATGTWSATSTPTQGGGPPVALLGNGDVWGGGGFNGDAVYHPATAKWTNIGAPPCTTLHQHCEAAGAMLKTGAVLVAGGITEVHASPYNLAETNAFAALLDPASLTWTATGSLKTSRVGETMTVLPNGQALVAGGETFDKQQSRLVPIASAELFTP